jgi:HTH-type transcriptional regulator, sugar sensing transcriptional regulator
MPDKLMAELTSIGLSELEARVYLALLGHYKVSARELSQLTGIFRTQIYDVLRTLIIKGFCTEVIDRVKTYVPVDPELAFREITLDLGRKMRITERLSAQLHQLFLVNENHNHDDEKLIEVIRSESAVRKRLRANLNLTREVIFSFNKPPYQIRFDGEKGNMPAGFPLDKQHIKHRAIFQIDSSDPWHSLEVAQSFREHGEDVRLTRYLPMEMVIFDNTTVFYRLTADHDLCDSDTATFIRHPEITLTLINSFWVEWQRCFTLEEFRQELNT